MRQAVELDPELSWVRESDDEAEADHRAAIRRQVWAEMRAEREAVEAERRTAAARRASEVAQRRRTEALWEAWRLACEQAEAAGVDLPQEPGAPEPRAWVPRLPPRRRAREDVGVTPYEERLFQLRPRPRTRGECEPGSPARWWGPYACPYAGCRYNLAVDVSQHGSLRVVLGLEDGLGSCALDVADDGAHTLEQVARLDGSTREAVRLVEGQAFGKCGPAAEQITGLRLK